MKVHLIKEKTIRNYTLIHAAGKSSFEDWLGRIRWADWNKPEDIKRSFPSADILGQSSMRVVFDIGGNNYRMICKYIFGKLSMRLYVCWIGTHADYDKLCDKNLQYTVFIY